MNFNGRGVPRGRTMGSRSGGTPTIEKWNIGVRYLLTVVDALSKYAWVELLKSETGQAMTSGLEKILRRARARVPNRHQTDKGNEF